MKKYLTINLLALISLACFMLSSCSNQPVAKLQKAETITIAQASEPIITEETVTVPVRTEPFVKGKDEATSTRKISPNSEREISKRDTKIDKKEKAREIFANVADAGKKTMLAPFALATKATKSIKGEKKKTVIGGLLTWALIFLVVAIIAAVLGFGALAETAASIAQVLFVIFLILFLIFLILYLL